MPVLTHWPHPYPVSLCQCFALASPCIRLCQCFALALNHILFKYSLNLKSQIPDLAKIPGLTKIPELAKIPDSAKIPELAKIQELAKINAFKASQC